MDKLYLNELNTLLSLAGSVALISVWFLCWQIAFIGSGKEVDRLSQKWGFEAFAVTQLGQQWVKSPSYESNTDSKYFTTSVCDRTHPSYYPKAHFVVIDVCSEFFMPGMVDTHIHASQYSYAGTALDMPLLQWLNMYTFPVEACYKDLEFARNVYTHIVVSCLGHTNTPQPIEVISALFRMQENKQRRDYLNLSNKKLTKCFTTYAIAHPNEHNPLVDFRLA